MRVLVCGDRNFQDAQRMSDVLVNWDITELIEGEAQGADNLAREYALKLGIPVRKFPAQWNKYGRAAGPIRNKQMLVEGKPELVIAFLAKGSIGTRNMINQAKRANVKVEIIHV